MTKFIFYQFHELRIMLVVRTLGASHHDIRVNTPHIFTKKVLLKSIFFVNFAPVIVTLNPCWNVA